MQINLLKMSWEEKLKEKIINKIKETKDCNNNKDKKDFKYTLKNHDVE